MEDQYVVIKPDLLEELHVLPLLIHGVVRGRLQGGVPGLLAKCSADAEKKYEPLPLTLLVIGIVCRGDRREIVKKPLVKPGRT